VRTLSIFAILCLGPFGALVACAAEFTVEETEEGVTINLDGQLFTKYVKQSGNKPILYPLIGPGGKGMTRAFPMERIRGERFDHPHHRSLWFTHGDVNGVDFWTEIGSGRGRTVHREFREIKGGETAVVTAVVDWVAADGKKLLEDERTYTARAEEDARIIDCDITLKATEGPVKFGDTKEGSFGVRVPTSMDVTSRQGGAIVTSEGLRDKDAWGKPAAWVDYHGPVQGETLGIAILNHPSSFRYPTRWHVRDYGLFAANPFGLSDFPKVEGSGGEYTLEPGGSLTLKYRVVLHKGNEQQGRIAERFSQYAGK
jgi:hypothetical protein